MCDVLGELLKLFPDEKWDFENLQFSASLNFIESHPEFNWNWSTLSTHKHLTREFIERNLNKPWNWKSLFEKGFIQNYFTATPESKFIESLFLDYLLDIRALTIELLEKHKNKNWDYNKLSELRILTCDFVESTIDKPWNWKTLSRNKNLSELAIKYPNKDWDWSEISLFIDIKLVKLNPNLPWQWFDFNYNQALTLDFVENNFDKTNWCDRLHPYAILTWEFVEKHITQNWNWNKLGRLVPLHIAELDYKKYIKTLHENPNVTLEFVEKHID